MPRKPSRNFIWLTQTPRGDLRPAEGFAGYLTHAQAHKKFFPMELFIREGVSRLKEWCRRDALCCVAKVESCDFQVT